jgi:hypothetical protein
MAQVIDEDSGRPFVKVNEEGGHDHIVGPALRPVQW